MNERDGGGNNLYRSLTREEARVGHAVAHLQTKTGEPPTTTEVAREARMPRNRVYAILNSENFKRFTQSMRRGRDRIYSMSPEMKLQFLILGTLVVGMIWLGYSQYAHEKAEQNRMMYQQHMTQQEFDKLMRETSQIQQNQGIIAGNQVYINGQLRQINYNLEGVGAQQRYIIQQNNLIVDNQGTLYDRQGQIYQLIDSRTGRIIDTQEQIGAQINLTVKRHEQETTALEDQMAALGKLIGTSTTTKSTSDSKDKDKGDSKKKETKTVTKSIQKTIEETSKKAKEEAKKEKKKEEEKKPWSGLLPWL